MRIMFAVGSYWPSQDGVANITKYLAEGLVNKGHEIFIFTSAGNGGLQKLPEKEIHGGVQIERMRVFVNWPRNLKGRDKKSTQQFYLERIKEYAPDILIVVCSQTWTFDWLMPYLDDLKLPKVFYCHGYSKWFLKYDYKTPLRHRNIIGVWEQYLCEKYYKHLHEYIAKYDLAIYLSEQNSGYQYAQKYGLHNGKILENAIEDIFFDPAMRHMDQEETKEELRFLFIANYSENKNHHMLIESYAKAKIGKSKLIFAGFEENEYSDALKVLTKDLLGDNKEKEVQFHVHLSRREIVELYRISDVFICPSKSETWSIVAHEAAATAMPIISTNVGIYSEIEGAYIVKDGMEMCNAIEEMYNHADLRKQSGMAAYQWVQTRNCRIADKIEWLEKELERLYENRKESDKR